MIDQPLSSHNQGSNIKAMPVKKAYLLLLLSMALAYFLVKPTLNILQQQRQQVSVLMSQLYTAQEQNNKLDRHLTTIKSTLMSMASSGSLSAHTQHSKVAEETQNTFKAAARLANASIQQLRPSTNDIDEFLSEHTLEVGYTINASSLNILLNELAKGWPAPGIKMLSLRSQELGQSTRNSENHLAAQILLSQASLKAGSLPEKNQSAILIQTIKPNRQASHNTELADSALNNVKTSNVESLFNAKLRARERSPSLAYYRLSAITINAAKSSVLLTDKTSGETTRLSVGETIAGWTLMQIDSQSIDLTKGEQSTRLSL